MELIILKGTVFDEKSKMKIGEGVAHNLESLGVQHHDRELDDLVWVVE